MVSDPEKGRQLGEELLKVKKRSAFTRVMQFMLLAGVSCLLLIGWMFLAMYLAAGLPVSSPLLVVVSIDGMRFDMVKRGYTPFMTGIQKGAVAPLKPQFPANTFPNHFTMVTGLYPARHGIVGNVFFDPQTSSIFVYDNSTLVRESKWWQAQPVPMSVYLSY